ncbi:type 2 lanthipeptide synthetase LanM [Staphylococcus agnetis]|uniref:type 2 lanthipeptide synthetase LanM n=1 Tax=Staphylococcus agnetis TaxID=985762 RepID=UPI00208FE64F|nr:type 2 lanthipeptide synthetase LanM [Staphylococcus agnetis]MCO4346589.1 type 2 lanthipeptide synthetase LanM [Staphylococcus agnetis]
MNNLIECLYTKYKLQCITLAERLSSEYKDVLSEEFYENLINNEKAYFKSLVMRYLVVDFQESVTIANKNIEGNKNLKKYTQNFNINDHIEFKVNIEGKIRKYRNNILNIISLFYEDKYLISIDNSSSMRISDIMLNLGDSHNDGKSVALIHFENGNKILFKPKNLVQDKLYFECLRKLNDKLNVNYDYPKIIVRDGYSWQSFVKHTKCKNEQDIDKYYYSLGIQTFLLYVLNGNDMHFENLIAYAGNPVFIDLETLLQTPASMILDGKVYDNSNVNNNVLNTLLFDFSDQESVMSFLGGTTNRKNLPIYDISMVNEDNDNIQLVESTKKITSTPPNIPIDILGNSVEIYEKSDCFLQGFVDSYNLTLTNPNIILKIVNHYNDFDIRIVLRPTTVYSNYVEYFKQMDQENEMEILKILEESIYFYKQHSEVAYYEFKTLKNFDIPYFKVSTNSVDLRSIDEQLVIPKFFQHSPRESLKIKLSQLSKRDMRRQIEILKLAISAYKEKFNNEPIDFPRKRATASNIHEEINKIQRYIDVEQPIYNIQLNMDGETDLTPISYDIYFGLAGISLLFLQYSEKYNNNMYREKSISLHNIIYNMWLIDSSSNFSAFHGRFSYFKYVLILNKYFNFNINFKEDLEKTLKMYVEYMRQNEKYPIDYLGGLSGVISLIIELYTFDKRLSFVEEYSNILMRLLLKHIDFQEESIYCKSDIKDENMTIGLAHGISGILLTLAKYNKIFESNHTIRYIRKIIEYENDIIDDNIPYIWCNGLTGLILVRNIMSGISNISKELNIDNLNFKLQKNYKLNIGAQSVCHGTSGNILVLKTLGFNIKNENIFQYEWCSGYNFPNESLSFFLGKVGQLFNSLSSDRDKEIITDILT